MVLNALGNLHRLFSTHPLSRHAPMQAWLRFASWQVRSRISEEVVVPWVDGQRLAVRNGMTGATGNIYVGLHEFADMMFPLHFLRDRDLFFDVGANVGTYTVLASGVCKAKTWAFEPDPLTVERLARNVEVNHLADLVTIFECAIGAVQGAVHVTTGRDTLNRVASGSEADVRSVRQETLDGLTASVGPIMLKIDVEGYEANVLCGSHALLVNSLLKAVELETVDEDIHRIMIDSGFERAYYQPFTRNLHAAPVEPPASNALFVRDRQFVQERLRTARKINILGVRI
ncbi:MAG TPA: FkbM family methyltransferase [Roseiarcus sp.]|nr:FkbM family methyltransferase [Roseiarcus sp.]